MVVLPADGGAPLPGIHTSSTPYDDRPFLFQRRLLQQPGRTPQRPASQISTKLACTFTLYNPVELTSFATSVNASILSRFPLTFRKRDSDDAIDFSLTSAMLPKLRQQRD